MTDINSMIINELSMEDVVNHLAQHKMKYLAGLGALAVGGAGYQGYKKYKDYKFNKSLKGHALKHRGTYGGAALGALTSLGSTAGTNATFGNRIKKALGSATIGGLAGSIADNYRHNQEWKSKYDNK